MPHLYQELLIHNWFVNVDRILDRHFDWNFNLSLYLDRRLLDVERLFYIDRLLHDSRYRYLNSFYHFLLHLLYYLHRHFLLHFNIFRDFHQFFNYSLGPSNNLRHLNYDFNWLLYNNLFDYLLGHSRLQTMDLLLSFFQKPPY